MPKTIRLDPVEENVLKISRERMAPREKSVKINRQKSGFSETFIITSSSKKESSPSHQTTNTSITQDCTDQKIRPGIIKL